MIYQICQKVTFSEPSARKSMIKKEIYREWERHRKTERKKDRKTERQKDRESERVNRWIKLIKLKLLTTYLNLGRYLLIVTIELMLSVMVWSSATWSHYLASTQLKKKF